MPHSTQNTTFDHISHQGIISPAYTVFYPIESSIQDYFSHFFKSQTFIDALSLYVTGIRQGQNIDFVKLNRSLLPVPPQNEQKSITAFVHNVSRRTSRFIRNRRRLIELLTEQKQAIINRAVTRGLNPDAPLKPSGIDWLGDIPAHWKIRRNTNLFVERIEAGINDLPILVVSLRTGVTVGEEVDERGRPKRLITDRAKYKYAHAGDITYNMMRLWQGAIGVAPVSGLVSPAYVVVQPASYVVPYFFENLFRTPNYMACINQESHGIVSDRNRTYWDDFKKIYSPVPPVNEQTEIVEFIQIETRLLSKAIKQANDEIDLIREYRTRLIADVVTGKLDVRGFVPPSGDELLEPEAEDLEDTEQMAEEEDADAVEEVEA